MFKVAINQKPLIMHHYVKKEVLKCDIQNVLKYSPCELFPTDVSHVYMCCTSLEITGFLLRAMLLTYPDTPSKHSSALHLCLCNASRLHTIKTDQGLFPGAIHHNSGNMSVSSKMSLYLLVIQSTHPSDPDGVDGRYFAKTNLNIKYNILPIQYKISGTFYKQKPTRKLGVHFTQGHHYHFL